MKTLRWQMLAVPGAVLALTACGSGSGSGANGFSFLPTTETTGVPTYDLTYLDATDMYRLDISGVLDFIPGDPALDLSGFDRASNAVSGTGLWVSRGDLTEVSLLYSESSGANLLAGQYASLGPSTFASNLTFTADGGYIGFITNAADGELGFLVTGDVGLTVDFDAASVSGAITNRTLRDPADNSVIPSDVTDIELLASTFDQEGLFSGGLTGGSFNLTIVENAGYEGLIAFDTDVESVGIVRLDHAALGGVLNETGSFATGHD